MTDDEPPPLNLVRNDLDGALKVFRWYAERDLECPFEVTEVLFHLQDDERPLIAALQRLDDEIARRAT